LLQQQHATIASIVVKKISCAGPKHFDQLKSEPDQNRKAQPDLQVTTLRCSYHAEDGRWCDCHV